MVARIFAPHPHTAHDTDAETKHDQPHRRHRLAELGTYVVHAISTIIVLAIVVYFIHEYGKGVTGAPFWTALAIMDIFVCLIALSRTFFRHRASDAALAMFTLSGLWLAALVLALKEYLDSTCRGTSPSLFDRCRLRSSHIAFTLVAFLTSLIAMVWEIKRWRHDRWPVLVDDKASQTSGPMAQNTPFPGQNTSYPTQTTSLPPQNTPFPAQSYSLPPQNTPFPAN